MFPFGKIVIICWIIFWLYWFIAAFGSKKNSTSNVKRFMGIRLFLLVAVIILFRFINVQNHPSFYHLVSNNDLVLVVGLIIFLSGLFIAVWARIYLGKNWGMPMSQKHNPELVTTGPYRYVRHPIYSGILVAVLGSAIADNPFWLIILVISGTYFVYSAVMEERLMLKQFPKVYTSYKSKTKMLIPFIY